MRLLDLFCGAGGCSKGYSEAGFEVVGVDIMSQPSYPFKLVSMDVLDLLPSMVAMNYDAIHASPPCQAYSRLRKLHPERSYPDLIEATRALLVATGLPYVIENVEGAPLIDPITLCGTMFGLGADGCELRRHRIFESNIKLKQPSCAHARPVIGVYGHGSNLSPKNPKATKYGRTGNKTEAQEALGIGWMTSKELSQAIPPAYTKYIGKQLMEALCLQL